MLNVKKKLVWFIVIIIFLLGLNFSSSSSLIIKNSYKEDGIRYGYNWMEIRNLDGSFTQTIYADSIFLDKFVNLTNSGDDLLVEWKDNKLKIKLKVKEKDAVEKDISTFKGSNSNIKYEKNISYIDSKYKFSWNLENQDYTNFDIDNFYIELENLTNMNITNEKNKFYLPDGLIIDLSDLIKSNYSLSKVNDKKIQINAEDKNGKTFSISEINLDPLITAVSSQDSYIYTTYKNNNYGTEDTATFDSATYHALVDFDISSLPANVTVTEASINLYFGTASSSDEKTAYPITKSWIEDEVTWNNRTTSVAWSTPGLGTDDYNTTYPSTMSGGSGAQKFDVTDWINIISNQPVSFYGFVLFNADTTDHIFYTKEYATVSRRPFINITYFWPSPIFSNLYPLNNTNQTTQTTQFNCSATMIGSEPTANITILEIWYSNISGFDAEHTIDYYSQDFNSTTTPKANTTESINWTTTLSDGIWYWYCVAEVTYVGGISVYGFASEEHKLTIDTIYPTFSTYWDNNDTLAGTGIGKFNVTLLNTNGTVILEINNTNITAKNLTSNVYNVSYNFVLNGSYSYKWHSWGNGTLHLYNVSEIRSYTVNESGPDTIYPVFSNNKTNKVNNSQYNPGFFYEFNITILNTNGTVGIEFNNTNYTLTNFTLSVYNKTFSTLEATNYSYYWWAYGNGTSHYYNISKTYLYTINQNFSYNLSIIGATSKTYPSQAGISNTSCPSQINCSLWRNNTGLITSPDNSVLSPGYYNYTFNTTGNTNYSLKSSSLIFQIKQNTSAIIFTYLNNTRSNITIYNNTAIWLNTTLFNVTGTINLYLEGTIIGMGTNQVGNFTAFNSTGMFNVTGVYLENINYSGNSETWWVNVTTVVCSQNLTNTTKTDWINIGSCLITDNQNQSRNWTQWDSSSCGEYENETFFEYQFIPCNYCSYELTNTTKTSWIDIEECQIDDLKNQSRNWTEYTSNTATCFDLTGLAEDFLANATYFEYQDVSCDYCLPNRVNTTWSDWGFTDVCQITDLQPKQRNLTEWDNNTCYIITSLPSDISVNTTIYEYGNDTCNYCSYNLTNTTISGWENDTCIGDFMNQTRFWIEYDTDKAVCYDVTGLPTDLFVNVTYYENQSVGPTYQNTSWSDWSSGVCEVNDLNQSRNLTQYDIYSCAANTTYFEYNLTTANLTYTDYTDWSNSTCSGNQMNQSRSRIQFDSNGLGCFSNLTLYDYQLTGPTYQNTTWSDWQNISCLSGDIMNQTRNLTQYDIYSCASNSTFYEYRAIEYCKYDTTFPNWTNLRNFTQTANLSFSQSIVATDNINISNYWLNDTTYFNINSTTGLIINVTNLSRIEIHWLNISVNDTSGNLLSGIFYINIIPLVSKCGGNYTSFSKDPGRVYIILCQSIDFAKPLKKLPFRAI